MGSNETATATTGGPRVIDVFDGNGAPSGPNYLLFSDADRPSDALRDRSKVGSSPRPHAPVLGALQRALDRELWRLGPRGLHCHALCLYVSTDGSGRARGIGAYLRLVPTLCDLRETSGPRIDRIPPTRPPWWRRQYRDIKKLMCSAHRKCPIGLCGPVSN